MKTVLIISIILNVCFAYVRFFNAPIPVWDKGHRVFSCKNEEALRVVLAICQQNGLKEKFSFVAGPTHQTILSDHTTVLNWHEDQIADRGLPPNAISVVCANPVRAAEDAARALRQAGFKAEVFTDIIPGAEGKFVGVKTDATEGWLLAFRKHLLQMGKPPGMHKVSK